MDQDKIRKLIEEYFGPLPPDEQRRIMSSVQKQLDMYTFDVLRELRDVYNANNLSP
ncbi:MAG: hypothetical protein ACOYEO_07755 [bacterium]|jgi:hypothetical protein